MTNSLFDQEQAHHHDLSLSRYTSHCPDRPPFPVRGRLLSLTLNSDRYANPGEMYRFCRLIHEAMACFVSQSTFVKLNVSTPHQKILWEFKEVYGARMEM
ncbi:type VI secretion system baseplate subunit TssF [Xenorhabdus sp. Sc-CR9]|uniref:type VI secretion system baseplate subunit TssF n=1 Tax=Xenorhabdus sp. Sc-CR9 TaxID=2584468 RepID=UPI001F32DA0C|nr:type VI secretion system baseplate subunit TssF [Xenorhabdus sp. Sc-CR9]